VTQLFVREMHRVAGLEGDHAFPAALLYFFANLHRGTESIGEVGFEVAEVEYLYRTADGVTAMAVEGGDSGVLVVERAVHLLGHGRHLLVADAFDTVDLLDCDYRAAVDVGVAQRDPLGAFDLGNRLDQVQNRNREKSAVTHVHVVGAAECVGQVHVTLQRGEVTAAEHYRVGGRSGTDFHRGQLRGFFDQAVALAIVIYIQRSEVLRTDGTGHVESKYFKLKPMYPLASIIAIESRFAYIDRLYPVARHGC
jgi:hypothetical protein